MAAAGPVHGRGKVSSGRRKAAPPIRTAADYPTNGDKRVADLETALRKCGLRDGMVISSHHHLRDGDRVALMALEAARKNRRQRPDLVSQRIVSLAEERDRADGVRRHPPHRRQHERPARRLLHAGQDARHGRAALAWRALAGDSGWRSPHRYRGHRRADRGSFGNCDGSHGKSACGSLGFALADSIYADHVIVVTDNLVPFPCVPWQIQGNNVDYVVEVDSIGDPAKIVSGTTQITRSPDRLRIAELVARFLRDAGIMRNGFSFQAGAGGIALAFVSYLKQMMKQAGVKARFVRGGSTKYLVELLEEGLTDYILDGQTFDLDGVRSMANNPRHVATSPFTSYNYHGKGNFASMVDAVVLGATEVDVNFNANVVTHSDGRLLHGIGGWQNCLASRCTILAVPSFRDRIPVIVDEVTTLCGPGELIDVVVTERGIAINPRRQDLIGCGQRIEAADPSAREIKEEVERICGGKPQRPDARRSSRGRREMGRWHGARYGLAIPVVKRNSKVKHEARSGIPSLLLSSCGWSSAAVAQRGQARSRQSECRRGLRRQSTSTALSPGREFRFRADRKLTSSSPAKRSGSFMPSRPMPPVLRLTPCT